MAKPGQGAALVEAPKEPAVMEALEEVVLAELYQAAAQRKAMEIDLPARAGAVRQGQPQKAAAEQGKLQAGVEAAEIRRQTVVPNYPATVHYRKSGKEASSGGEAPLKEESSHGVKV